MTRKRGKLAVIDDEVELKEWDQQPGETLLWFQRFEEFRKMGPNRSINAVQNIYRVQKGFMKATRATTSWRKNAEKYRWRERAAAFDKWKIEEGRRKELEAEKQRELEVEQDRQKERETRQLLLKAYRSKWRQALEQLDPTKAGWRTVTDGLAVMLAQGRAEWDDEPTQRREISGPKGQPIGVDITAQQRQGEGAIQENAEYFREFVTAMAEAGLLQEFLPGILGQQQPGPEQQQQQSAPPPIAALPGPDGADEGEFTIEAEAE